MIIACPNCGAALELPEESVGAKVQCPVCETSFVSTGPDEWRGRTEQRLWCSHLRSLRSGMFIL